jgi:hypothetical protein
MPMGITSANQTFVGLHAVIENSDNFCAFRFTTSAGQYQVDWGDGTVDLVDSGVNAEHQYNFATYDTGNTTLSSRGYKQAMITVTPVSGDLLTCNFQQRFVTSPVQNQAYSTGFLDCILSMPNANSGTSNVFGGTTVRHSFVERFDIKTIGNATSLFELFRNCRTLQSVPLFDTSNCTRFDGMFRECTSIRQVPELNSFNNITFSSIFQECSSLISCPSFNCQNVTTTVNMFSQCFNLKSIPQLNTSIVTNMSGMFFACNSLNSIPALSTESVTDFGTLFARSCISLNRCQMVFTTSVNFQACQLSRDAIVEIFNNLVDRTLTTSATITITENWGVTALSAGDLLIATNKNWVVIQ